MVMKTKPTREVSEKAEWWLQELRSKKWVDDHRYANPLNANQCAKYIVRGSNRLRIVKRIIMESVIE